MLISDIKLILSPVIVAINGEENEYENGTSAVAAFKSDSRLEVKSLSVRDEKIVIQLVERKTNPPFNFIGEMAVE